MATNTTKISAHKPTKPRIHNKVRYEMLFCQNMVANWVRITKQITTMAEYFKERCLGALNNLFIPSLCCQ